MKVYCLLLVVVHVKEDRFYCGYLLFIGKGKATNQHFMNRSFCTVVVNELTVLNIMYGILLFRISVIRSKNVLPEIFKTTNNALIALSSVANDIRVIVIDGSFHCILDRYSVV